MIDVTLTTERGTLVLDYKHGWVVTGIEGILSVPIAVGLAQNAQLDGSYIDSSRVPRRVISVTCVPLGRRVAVEKRRQLAEIFLPHQPVTVTVTRDGRTRSIVGYRQDEIQEDDSPLPYTRAFTFELVCPAPFFTDDVLQTIVFRQIVPLWTFPLTSYAGAGLTVGMQTTTDSRYLKNDGDVACGIVAKITAHAGAVTNPSISDGTRTVKVICAMTVGDVVEISTVPGEKYIKKNGASYMYFDKTSEFFSVGRGVSEITVAADGGTVDNLRAEVEYRRLYSGV